MRCLCQNSFGRIPCAALPCQSGFGNQLSLLVGIVIIIIIAIIVMTIMIVIFIVIIVIIVTITTTITIIMFIIGIIVIIASSCRWGGRSGVCTYRIGESPSPLQQQQQTCTMKLALLGNYNWDCKGLLLHLLAAECQSATAVQCNAVVV